MSLPQDANQTPEMEALAAQYPPAIVNKVVEIRATKEKIGALQEEVTKLRAQLGETSRDQPEYNDVAVRITAVVNQVTALGESREVCKAELDNLLQRYHLPAAGLKKLL